MKKNSFKFFKGYTKIAILFWIALMCIFWFPIYDSLSVVIDTILVLVAIFLPILIVSTYLTNRLLPQAVTQRKMKKFIAQFFLVSFFMAILFYGINSLFKYLETIGFIAQSDLFDHSDRFWHEIMSTYPSFILVNAAFCGLRFYYEHTKLQEVHLESQLQILQAQVNPHFMFNVLNHIHILIRKDVELAAFLLEKYSEILRYQLYQTKKELVPLKQDIQFAKDVVSIERLRWGDDLSVNCTWNIENGGILIPPLLLITFIENAFKHVSRSMTDKGYINLTLRQHGDIIYLEIENSKSKYKQQEEKNPASGLGLNNIKERLMLLYPNRHTLKIEETDWAYKVELTIILN